MTATAEWNAPAIKDLASTVVTIENLASPDQISLVSSLPTLKTPSSEISGSAEKLAALEKSLTRYCDTLQGFANSLDFHKDDYGDTLIKLLHLLTTEYFPLERQILGINFSSREKKLTSLLKRLDRQQLELKNRVGALLDTFPEGNNWPRLLAAWEIFIRPDFISILEQADWLEKLAHQAEALFGVSAKKRLLSASADPAFSLDDFLQSYLATDAPADLTPTQQDQLKIFLRPILDALIQAPLAAATPETQLPPIEIEPIIEEKPLETEIKEVDQEVIISPPTPEPIPEPIPEPAPEITPEPEPISTPAKSDSELVKLQQANDVLSHGVQTLTSVASSLEAKNLSLEAEKQFFQHQLQDLEAKHQHLQQTLSQAASDSENQALEISALKQQIFLLQKDLKAANSASKGSKNGVLEPSPTVDSKKAETAPSSFTKLKLPRRLLSPDFPLTKRVGQTLSFARLNQELRCGLAGLQYVLENQGKPDFPQLTCFGEPDQTTSPKFDFAQLALESVSDLPVPTLPGT